MNITTYDFGYDWPWNYGHLVFAAICVVLGLLAWRFRWPRTITALSAVLAVWGVVGFLIVQLVVRMNLPLELPTEQFLPQGTGRVLDAGAGSGRSALMVLLARPKSRVLALDRYEGYYGISDNTPTRLLDNAAAARVGNRIDVQVGDMLSMPLADGSLDAAVSAYAIDHLNAAGVERSLAEIARVIRPNGQFLLMVINNDAWIRVAFPFFMHHGYFGRRTNAERWRQEVTKAGFEILEEGTRPATRYLLAARGTAPAGGSESGAKGE